MWTENPEPIETKTVVVSNVIESTKGAKVHQNRLLSRASLLVSVKRSNFLSVLFDSRIHAQSQHRELNLYAHHLAFDAVLFKVVRCGKISYITYIVFRGRNSSKLTISRQDYTFQHERFRIDLGKDPMDHNADYIRMCLCWAHKMLEEILGLNQKLLRRAKSQPNWVPIFELYNLRKVAMQLNLQRMYPHSIGVEELNADVIVFYHVAPP
jgi:hypothetical protein